MNTQPVPTFPMVKGLEHFQDMSLNDLIHNMQRLDTMLQYLEITESNGTNYIHDDVNDLSLVAQETVDYFIDGLNVSDEQRNWLVSVFILKSQVTTEKKIRDLINACFLTTLDHLV